jgi:hypothetical protein
VWDAQFLRHFCVPSNIVKYDGKTYPSVWLEAYYLACRAGGADDDLSTIQFHPIYFANSASAWLDDLLRNIIKSWDDLKEFFTGNFQGTYVRPGNPWKLKSCRQKSGESLHDYIRCFSQKCHELPSVADIGISSALINKNPSKSCSILPHGTPVARRQSVLPSSWATRKQPLVAAEHHKPKPPSRALGRAPRMARRGRSGAPTTSLSQPMTSVMMRKLATSTRSML